MITFYQTMNFPFSRWKSLAWSMENTTFRKAELKLPSARNAWYVGKCWKAEMPFRPMIQIEVTTDCCQDKPIFYPQGKNFSYSWMLQFLSASFNFYTRLWWQLYEYFRKICSDKYSLKKQRIFWKLIQGRKNTIGVLSMQQFLFHEYPELTQSLKYQRCLKLWKINQNWIFLADLLSWRWATHLQKWAERLKYWGKPGSILWREQKQSQKHLFVVTNVNRVQFTEDFLMDIL